MRSLTTFTLSLRLVLNSGSLSLSFPFGPCSKMSDSSFSFPLNYWTLLVEKWRYVEVQGSANSCAQQDSCNSGKGRFGLQRTSPNPNPNTHLSSYQPHVLSWMCYLTLLLSMWMCYPILPLSCWMCYPILLPFVGCAI